MAPKKDAKKDAKAANKGDLVVPKPFAERFAELELPSIEYSVTIRARCHPNMLERIKCSFDWMADDMSAMNKPADGLPASLKEFTENEAASFSGTETQVKKIFYSFSGTETQVKKFFYSFSGTETQVKLFFYSFSGTETQVKLFFLYHDINDRQSFCGKSVSIYCLALGSQTAN